MQINRYLPCHYDFRKLYNLLKINTILSCISEFIMLIYIILFCILQKTFTLVLYNFADIHSKTIITELYKKINMKEAVNILLRKMKFHSLREMQHIFFISTNVIILFKFVEKSSKILIL